VQYDEHEGSETPALLLTKVFLIASATPLDLRGALGTVAADAFPAVDYGLSQVATIEEP